MKSTGGYTAHLKRDFFQMIVLGRVKVPFQEKGGGKSSVSFTVNEIRMSPTVNEIFLCTTKQNKNPKIILVWNRIFPTFGRFSRHDNIITGMIYLRTLLH